MQPTMFPPDFAALPDLIVSFMTNIFMAASTFSQALFDTITSFVLA